MTGQPCDWQGCPLRGRTAPAATPQIRHAGHPAADRRAPARP